tara:strand:- start:439 stop:936 length:498 start_codon:yes stop_codon:yes gene_type:complete
MNKERKFKDGWEIIPKESVTAEIMDVISDGKEQDRVVDIMEDLLGDCHTELSHYFSEIHGFGDGSDSEKVYEEIPDNMSTVYSSVYLNDLPDSGYNCISIGYGEVYEGESFNQRDVYICLSMNGCSFASALSQYYKFTVPVIERYSLLGMKKMVDAMNGHLTSAT